MTDKQKDLLRAVWKAQGAITQPKGKLTDKKRLKLRLAHAEARANYWEYRTCQLRGWE